MSSSHEATRDFSVPLAGDEGLAPGSFVGPYRITRVIGRGGSSIVYEAEHVTLARRSALKVLNAQYAQSGEMLQRFVREARVVNEIRHPNVVDVFDLGTLPNGQPWFAMELLDGAPLSEALSRAGRFDTREAVHLVLAVCEPLAAAHAAGVVHRDLKLSNVVALADGRLKLLDFGIAKLLPAHASATPLTAVGQRLGTMHSMAPEQLRAQAVDVRTDVYALGVMLYALLTGRHPFESDDVVELERLQLEAPPPPPGRFAPVPPALEKIVLRCLEKDPAARFESVPSLAAALRDSLSLEREATWREPAAVIYIEAELGQDEEAGLRLLEGIVRELVRSGFLVPLHSGSSLLALRPGDEQAMRDTLTRGRALHLRLRQAGVVCSTSLHVAPAEFRMVGQSLEVCGGEALDVSEWACQSPQAVEFLTREAKVVLGQLQPSSEG